MKPPISVTLDVGVKATALGAFDLDGVSCDLLPEDLPTLQTQHLRFHDPSFLAIMTNSTKNSLRFLPAVFASVVSQSITSAGSLAENIFVAEPHFGFRPRGSFPLRPATLITSFRE
jgi:hypothetical protein